MMSARKRFAWILGAGAAWLLFGTSASRADIFRSREGYVVNVPHGWQITHETKTYNDHSGLSTDMVYAHPRNAMPIFRVEVDPQRAAAMESAPTLVRIFFAAKYPSFRLADQNFYLLKGVKTLQSRGWCDFEGKSMWIDMLFVINNGKNYTITLLSPAETSKASEATYGEIITSLQWAKPQR